MDLNEIYNNASAILLSSQNCWIDESYLYVFSGKPEFTLYLTDNNLFLGKNNEITELFGVNPFDFIEQQAANGKYAAGYISYNYLEYTDIGLTLRNKKFNDNFPLLYFNFYSPAKLDKFNIKQAEKILNIKQKEIRSKQSDIQYSTHKEGYILDINKIKEYIENGDVYQVNLSHKITTRLQNNPLNTFFNYYKAQPVPYGIYIDCDKFHFLGGSMEQFVEKRGDIITTKPIKGTSKRNQDKSKDDQIKANLSTNPKEKAENLMIVDLMRNDLSRVCKPATVKVNKLFNVKSYRTLHQMESEITGQLLQDKRLKDIIYSVFPPGSVTGAPKKRSIQIIDELENHSRGPYCGCAGVFSPNGDFTLCVSIRTAILEGNTINYWAGSGIVYDSDAEKEYQETLLKQKAFLNSIN